MLYKISLLLFFSFNIFSYPFLLAQQYHFPLNPGQKCYLTGNVGEIRSQHFHTGLDIAVLTGTKVYAAADGYVSRVRVSTFGFGKAIYITHPATQEQTVYAHLEKFNEKIGAFVRKKQYSEEVFEVDIYPEAQELPVKKGEMIAFTGNTGASGGPHLHYEIRTLDDIALNPLLYGFKEIPTDNLAPLIKKIALKTLDKEARVNQQFGRTEYTALKTGLNQYQISQTISAYGWLGLEVFGYDVANGVYNTFGFNKMEVFVNGERSYLLQLNQISHENNRSMNVHIDYENYQKTGQGFHRCYVADGNRLKELYQTDRNKGKILVEADKVYSILLKVYDSNGNQSSLGFKINGKEPAKTAKFIPDLSPIKSNIQYEISENTLLIKANHLKQKGNQANLSFAGIPQTLPLAYMQGKTCFYLWDLRQGLPDYVEIDDLRQNFNFRMLIPSEKDFFYTDERLNIRFSKNALFDTLYLEAKTYPSSLEIGSQNIPLFENIEVGFHIADELPLKAKTGMYENNLQYRSSQWNNQEIKFLTRSFGKFYLKKDLNPPVIKLFKKSPQSISFFIADDLSGIDTFRATLDGKFLLMNYEHKSGFLISEPENEKEILKGSFKLIIRDKAGNIQETTLIL